MIVDIVKIDKLREKKGGTNTTLSVQAGISEQTLRNIRKSGKCTVKIAECIAEAFGVEAKAISPEENPEDPKPELPEAIEETLKAVKGYGDTEYQRGKNEMCDIFIKAVKEAIERWKENNG